LLCSLNLGDTTNLAHTLNNLGTAYRQLGQFGEAEKAYERALQLISRLHGRDQPGSHFIVINLALLRMHLGKWKLALEDATRTAAMLRRRLGEDDLDYAAAISAQSLIRFNMGDYYQAERLARRVSAIRERKLGRDHPETPKTLNNLGEIVLAQNRPAEAEKLFTEGYRVLSASPSDQHIDTYTVNNLATVRLVQRRSTGVAELLENAVVNINHTQKSHHPYALRVNENLASAYLQSGRFREAEVQIKATLARLEGAIGSDNPQLVRTLKTSARSFAVPTVLTKRNRIFTGPSRLLVHPRPRITPICRSRLLTTPYYGKLKG
jgi:tetratricopeptide (TPR) repeat protein